MSLAPDIVCATTAGYDIQIVKNGVTLARGQGSKISHIDWQRALDGITTSTVIVQTPGLDCCGDLIYVDYWNTTLTITFYGLELWSGPVLKATARKGSVEITAQDNLAWATKRIIETDYNQTKDSAQIALDLWNQELGDLDIEVIAYDTGIIESRSVEANDYRKLWSFYGEMLPTSLDVTTFGSRVLLGLPEFEPIYLDDTMVTGEVAVIKDGEQAATQFIANASKDVVGSWPPGPAAPSNGYPLMQEIINDGTIQDEATAINAAHAAYDFNATGIRRIDAQGGLTLNPSSTIDPHKLVAGQLVTFTSTQTCFGATETLRLGSLTVTVEGGQEVVQIDLQPVGALQGLDSI